ncbi:transcription cofactor vestigial-like protein 1 [Zootoca vivipara]|uniref:transcription cofactor vestigial-like protein 1 n=1 Tax=Zootoca vivipara TaxID=8524 RepID=UPI00293B9295|nr:transcription cofactor vestigial-like protein 1 [Zootoca vivipara]
MEERKDSTKLCKCKQPVKTEWGAQCVVFTYFQGDINSVADEHFSRALSASKTPQDLSRKNSGEDAIVQHDELLLHIFWLLVTYNAAAAATSPYPPSLLQGITPPATELWQLPSGGNPNLTAASVYPPSMPDMHMTQGSVSDGKYGSLLGLLQQERCPSSVQEPLSSGSACPTSSARLQNMSQSLTSGGGIPENDRRRDLYF